MEYEHLMIERDGHVVTCRMSNPPEQTFTTRMHGELHHFLGSIENDESVRVLVCTGVDDVFIRWMDLTEIQAISQGTSNTAVFDAPGTTAQRTLEVLGQMPAEITPIHQLAIRLQNLKCVSIAAINGQVGGGGCEFSLAFDFRLMKRSSEATFALPQSSFGLVPGGGGAWFALKMLGRAKALDLLLHGEFIAPEEALELGLISRLYSEETYEEEVNAFVGNMANRAPLALRGIKELVNYGTNQEMRNFFNKEVQELGKVITSEDVMHALGMWLSNPDFEAYKPQFKGK